MLVIGATACTISAGPAPTPTPTDPPPSTQTPLPTATQTPLPTATATVTQTPLPTATPTITPTATQTPLPTTTPAEVAAFTSDNWGQTDIPAFVNSGLVEPYIAFLNLNDRDNLGGVLTPQPGTGVQTLYYSPPRNRAARIEILQLPESTGNRVYVAPDGLGIAYFIEAGEGRAPGLYLSELESGLDIRLISMDTLLQRGFVVEPAWQPDGEAFAMMLATGYATDIFLVQRDGLWRNLTQSGAYDLFPAFSPNGDYLAFVSDREVCPTWIPEQPGTCDGTDTPPPDGGHLHVMEMATGEVTKLADVWITPGNAPQWVNDRQIAFAAGEPLFGDTERTLWLADVQSGQSREVRPQDVASPLMLAEAWSPDGTQVLYQAAGVDSSVSLLGVNGSTVGSLSQFNYPRYGVAASWAPNSDTVAVGGVGGQCPFGATVLDDTLGVVTNGNPPPSMCTPRYSPAGEYIAFTGVSLNRFDGRADVYVANPNGQSALNMTGDLRGTMTLLGWIR